LAHILITTHGLVGDSWFAAHPDSQPSSTTTNYSDSDRIRLLGVTCDSKLNTWRAYDLAKDMDDPTAKRLDYVFVNQDRAAVQECSVVFTEPVPDLNCSYSDHFGIHVKLQLRNIIKDDSDATFAEENGLSSGAFDMIDRIAERYLAREIRHSSYRNWHFIVSVFVFIGLLIGQWWVKPNYAHFIILLFGMLVMVTGTVDGLIGFLFGRWEIGALKEFISEVQLARKLYVEDSN
jgi:sphingomyelin phosphodiesterase 2